MSSVADPVVAAAIDAAAAAIARLVALELTPADVTDAYALVRETEQLGRRIGSVQQSVLDGVDRTGTYKPDGHANAPIMVRHAANLSKGEGKRRSKAMRMLRDLPAVAAAFRAGRIGLPQLDRIARVHGNQRVRAELIAVDAHVAELAARMSYPEFDRKPTDWERLADEDGARDRADRNHQRRDFLWHRNFDGSVTVLGGGGGLHGAELAAIHAAYVAAEFAADWAEAVAIHGDETTIADLSRTDAQRRWDANYRIYLDAAAARAASEGGSRIVTNIVIDQETFERMARAACGEEVEPDDRLGTFFQDLLDDFDDGEAPAVRPEPEADGTDWADARRADEPATDGSAADGTVSHEPDGADAREAKPAAPTRRRRQPFRCETLDGDPLDPSAVTAAALIGHIRRGVVRADGVTIDLGRLSRFFTNSAQLAVQLQRTTCYWPGCAVPVTQCQIDHLESYNGRRSGRTCPDNGGPACGKHNRIKEHGFTVWRDPQGNFHVHRPDGSEIPYLP